MIEPTGFADGLDVTCETEWSRGNPPPHLGFWSEPLAVWRRRESWGRMGCWVELRCGPAELEIPTGSPGVSTKHTLTPVWWPGETVTASICSAGLDFR